MILYLLSSLCGLIGSLIAAPLVVQADFPVELTLLLSSLLLGVSLRLGYLFYQSKKHSGTFSLRGIVLYWGHMPWWQYLLICLSFLGYALGVDVLLQPVSRALITHAFWWLPMALLPSAAAVKLTTATLITRLLLLLIDGIIAPCVEELPATTLGAAGLARASDQLPAVYAGAFLAAVQLPAHFPAGGCIGYLAHAFKKETDLACPIALFPGHETRWRDKGNLFISLDGERKTPSGKNNGDVLAADAVGNPLDAGREVFFPRNLDRRR